MYTDYVDENNNENYYEEPNNKKNKDKLKKILFFVLIFVVVLILIVLLAKGCIKNNNGVTSNNSNQETSIVLNRKNISIQVDEKFELIADVLFTTNTDIVVTWYTENSSIADVDDTGVVTGISEGTTNVVAMYYDENGKVYSSKCEVVVTTKVVLVERIDIVQEEITLKKNDAVLLEINLEPSDATSVNLVYKSDNPTVATVSDKGYINAIDYGTTTISVETEDGSLKDSVVVNVTETGQMIVNPVSIYLSGLSNGLSVGTTATISYYILPNSATEREITWTSSDPNVAIVNDGVVTGINPGICKIIASTKNNISASIEVTVNPSNIPVSGVTINGETSISMHTGETRLINYTITPGDATNKKVLYTTSDSNVVFINSSGIMAALSAGSAVVTVTTEDGRKSASINVTVVGESNESSSQTGSSSGSSSSSSSSGSAGSSSSSSSGSSSTVSGGSTTTTCNSSDIVTISHNGKSVGAVVSSIRFGNASPFKGMTITPLITIDKIADCINTDSLMYFAYYGTSESNVSTSSYKSGKLSLKSGITLNKGEGYYKIKIKAATKEGKDIYKYYYAIVENAAVNVTTTLNYTYKFYDYSEKKLYIDYNNDDVRFCIDDVGCTPKSSSSDNVSGSSIISVDIGKKVCAASFKNGVRTSIVKCEETKAPTISVAQSLSNSVLTLTPTLKTTGEGNAKIYYCTNTSKCSVNTSSQSIGSGTPKSYSKYSTTIYACFQAIDKQGNRSQRTCWNLNTQKYAN